MAAFKRYRSLLAPLLSAIAGVAFITAGCSNGTAPAQQTSTAPAGASATASKGRAQLWSENCMRCHNMRSPETYSDAQWEVAMHHMRLRGDLTAEEHRAILELLKSSN